MRILLSLLSAGMLSAAVAACSKGSSDGGSSKAPGKTNTPTNPTDPSTNPPVGTVSDAAGFFVEVLGDGKDLLNMHKGLETFDEPCKLELGEIIDCYVEGEEQTFFARPFTLHYHVPKTMCSYVSVMPFYFVNRQTKLQTTALNVFVDKNGAVGIDNSPVDGVIDTPLGCATQEGTAICCVGNYTETMHIWDSTTGAYSAPATAKVTRPISACLGGPAIKSQPLDTFGMPYLTFYYVEGTGISKEYAVDTPTSHSVDNAWITNYFKPADHPGGIPAAFQKDIDITAGTFEVGHPYYTVTCHDSAWETLAQVNIQLREWNTKSAFDARKTATTNHDETGLESSPFGTHPKNDYDDWLDLETASITYPNYTYK